MSAYMRFFSRTYVVQCAVAAAVDAGAAAVVAEAANAAHLRELIMWLSCSTDCGSQLVIVNHYLGMALIKRLIIRGY